MIKSFLYRLKRNSYQKFFVKLLALFIMLAFLDFIIGSWLSIYYFKQESGLQYRTTFSIEKTTADLLVFGTSTATHDYYPEIFQKRLNMSYYNVAREGNSIFYHYAVLKAILRRYTPKIIIYDFDVNEFSKDEASYDKLSALLPYYKKHPEIRTTVELKSPYEKFKLISKIYPYNSSIFTILGGNMDYGNKRRRNIDININGYMPLTSVWNEPMKESGDLMSYDLDANKIRIYESFIKECINSKVEVYIVCSPLFTKHDHVSYSVALGRGIADKYNVSFFDYSSDSTILSNPKLFADILHLNDDGAKVYSNKIIDRILIEYPKGS
jgi:hypothetical protein